MYTQYFNSHRIVLLEFPGLLCQGYLIIIQTVLKYCIPKQYQQVVYQNFVCKLGNISDGKALCAMMLQFNCKLSKYLKFWMSEFFLFNLFSVQPVLRISISRHKGHPSNRPVIYNHLRCLIIVVQ